MVTTLYYGLPDISFHLSPSSFFLLALPRNYLGTMAGDPLRDGVDHFRREIQ